MIIFSFFLFLSFKRFEIPNVNHAFSLLESILLEIIKKGFHSLFSYSLFYRKNKSKKHTKSQLCPGKEYDIL